MAYVDLNPARAGMSHTLAGSKHTSIQRRLNERGSLSARTASSRPLLDRPLKLGVGIDSSPYLSRPDRGLLA